MVREEADWGVIDQFLPSHSSFINNKFKAIRACHRELSGGRTLWGLHGLLLDIRGQVFILIIPSCRSEKVELAPCEPSMNQFEFRELVQG